MLNCQSSQSEKQVVTEGTPVEKKVGKLLHIEDLTFQHLLDSFKLDGTVLIFDEQENALYFNDLERAYTGQLPASTFKIPNTIIALETGIASGPEHLFPWDGTDRWLDAWEQDLTLKQAYSVSCVPCYQEVARAVGPEKMRSELERLGYPEMVFDAAAVDNFWLRGESRITPYQQIQFLRRLYHEELPIKKTTQAAIREIMLREQTEAYSLSGKTGWSIDGEKNNGWFVGFVERGGKVYYFATNVEPGAGFEMDGFAAVRVAVTRLALTRLGYL
ncbi:class D beta-lactamase [Neolewinella aurantiaca]|uniref:Beta-lactamase n=1 Tax=Neolewinella aurantiaca TaxID=2602767 RepID=A0A5C7FN30_9BACT|nr:class D beta-lactamase [Neolewinella aurantiaca]TXF88894.1 class D beta-lactamase [Neolewinella aurantiaca]